jgi:cytochrome P450
MNLFLVDFITDPALYPEPDKYKGFRFHNLASDAAKIKTYGIATGNNKDKKTPSVAYAASHWTSIAFGYSRHACPGQFFAFAEIKAIMIYLLDNCDFKLPEGKPTRPPSLVVGDSEPAKPHGPHHVQAAELKPPEWQARHESLRQGKQFRFIAISRALSPLPHLLM